MSDASSIVIITSDELFIPNTCFYENGSSLCTLPDCCHYVDRNNRPKVMQWNICTSTALFALNADSDAVMTVFEVDKTISLMSNFSELKVKLVASKE